LLLLLLLLLLPFTVPPLRHDDIGPARWMTRPLRAATATNETKKMPSS